MTFRIHSLLGGGKQFSIISRKYAIFTITIFNGGFWFRLFGVGLTGTSLPPFFSERMGIRKKLKIGKYRYSILNKWKKTQ